MRWNEVITCIPQQIKLLTWSCLILAEACCKIPWGGRYSTEPGNLSSAGSLVSTAKWCKPEAPSREMASEMVQMSMKVRDLRSLDPAHPHSEDNPSFHNSFQSKTLHLLCYTSSFFRFLPSVGLEWFQSEQHLIFYSPFTLILTSRLPSSYQIASIFLHSVSRKNS